MHLASIVDGVVEAKSGLAAVRRGVDPFQLWRNAARSGARCQKGQEKLDRSMAEAF